MAWLKRTKKKKGQFLHHHKYIERRSRDDREPQEAQYIFIAEKDLPSLRRWYSISSKIEQLFSKPSFEFDIKELNDNTATFQDAKEILDSRFKGNLRGPNDGVNLHAALYFRYLSNLLMLNPDVYPGYIDIAESLLRTSLEIVHTLDGDHHRNYAVLLNDLSSVVAARGDNETAKHLQKKAEEILKNNETS